MAGELYFCSKIKHFKHFSIRDLNESSFFTYGLRMIIKISLWKAGMAIFLSKEAEFKERVSREPKSVV